jgi:hypothetical protein
LLDYVVDNFQWNLLDLRDCYPCPHLGADEFGLLAGEQQAALTGAAQIFLVPPTAHDSNG